MGKLVADLVAKTVESSWISHSSSFIEVVIIQIFILLSFLLLFFVANPFYALMYFFINTLMLGIVIAFLNIEFFTGFLYVLEITVVFIMLILFFFFNFKTSSVNKEDKNVQYWVLMSLTLALIPTVYNEEEGIMPAELTTYNLWDDYYQALNQFIMNDFAGLYISYYLIHSLEFIIIGFFLFIGSVACVAIYTILGFSKKISYSLFLNFIASFNKIYNLFFMRKQNMIYQAFTKDNIRYGERKRTEPKGMNDGDKDTKSSDKDTKSSDKDTKSSDKDTKSFDKDTKSSDKGIEYNSNVGGDGIKIKKVKRFNADYEKREKERIRLKNKKKAWLNLAVMWDKYYFSEDYKYSKTPLSRLQKYHYAFKARPYVPNRHNKLLPDLMPYKRK